jgi:hypothetical protein
MGCDVKNLGGLCHFESCLERLVRAALARDRPRWWVAATALDNGSDSAGA